MANHGRTTGEPHNWAWSSVLIAALAMGCGTGPADVGDGDGGSTGAGGDTLPTISASGADDDGATDSGSEGGGATQGESGQTDGATDDGEDDTGSTGGDPMNPEPWDGDRTVFVHLFEWSWPSIAEECETFLGPRGFSAVQVSPPQEYPDGFAGDPWYDRYQAVSYDIVGRSGDEAAFADMVERCADVGVEIYVDAIVNHMAAPASGTGVAGTEFTKYEYPGLYGEDNFHGCHHDIMDWGNRIEVQVCELFGLSDLDTSQPYVQQQVAGFLAHLMDLGVTGFRIDAAKHVWSEELQSIVDLAGGDPHIYQEVIYDAAIPAEEYFVIGEVTELGHGAQLANTFRTGDLAWLEGFGEAWGMIDSDNATVFLDNHDTQRHELGTSALSFREPELYRLANVFMLAWNYGHPKVMSSYAFTEEAERPGEGPDGLTIAVHDDDGNCSEPWVCEHRWPEIAEMVMFRNLCHEPPVAAWWSDGADQIAFAREGCGFVAINRDEGASLAQSLATTLPAGTYCDVLSGGVDDTGRSVRAGRIIGIIMAEGIISEQRTLHRADGRQLGFAEYGDPDGHIVLAFHGVPGARFMFRPTALGARRLGMRIIAPDRPGYGLSEPQPGRSLADWLDDVAALTRHLDIASFSLIGISGGGPFATATAAHFGDRVKALGLVSPMGPVAELVGTIPMPRLQQRFFLDLPSSDRFVKWGTSGAAALFRLAPGAAYDIAVRTLPPSDQEIMRQPHIRAHVIADVKESLTFGGAGSRDDWAIFSQPWGVDYSCITARSILWQGLDDTIVPIAAALALGRRIPGCRIVELAGEGHFWALREVDEVLGRIHQFATG